MLANNTLTTIRMKTIYKSLLLTLLIFSVAAVYTSCSEDSLPNNGEPRIRYVRITAPGSSDSLLVAAFQGSVVAITGENLQDTREIWFNDRKASLSPTYITGTTIITTVPSQIPEEVSNKMTLVFGNGQTLEYPFEVAVSEPEVLSMVSEYVPTGGVATIRGDYFYEPLTVTFTGGVTATIVSVDEKVLEVEVPEGVQPGPITVTTNFGETVSDFWFRDNRNIFISSDPFTGWWNENYVVKNPGAGDPPAINGNYIRVKKIVDPWVWTEVAGGPASAMGDISKNIPDEAILKPEKYNFKFEVNTMKPYDNNMFIFNVGLISENNNAYKWAPPYDTKGKWQTVVIPFEEVMKAQRGTAAGVVNHDGYWTRILMQGPGRLDADISFDNFRVVPKTLD